jgi:hypothetical protein
MAALLLLASAGSSAAAAGTASPPPPLVPEAAATAAGDIPDNQVFLVFSNRAAGYSLKYPEGWAQQGGGPNVTFRDKNNIVRIVVAKGPPPTLARIVRDSSALSGGRVTSGPQVLRLGGGKAFKLVYTIHSAPNSVTGKRVLLVVDRYYLWRGAREAVVDLGTPQGVDNVDAYRLMIDSFRWT